MLKDLTISIDKYREKRSWESQSWMKTQLHDPKGKPDASWGDNLTEVKS
jgi:hypothetical protein